MLPEGTPLAGTPYLKHTELFVPQQFPMVPEITAIGYTFPDPVFFCPPAGIYFSQRFPRVFYVSGETVVALSRLCFLPTSRPRFPKGFEEIRGLCFLPTFVVVGL